MVVRFPDTIYDIGMAAFSIVWCPSMFLRRHFGLHPRISIRAMAAPTLIPGHAASWALPRIIRCHRTHFLQPSMCYTLHFNFSHLG